MFWKDLLPLWQKTCKLPSVWLETLEKHCQKQCFGRISYLKSPHGGKPPLAPLTDRNKPAVWAATPREAGWIPHGFVMVCLKNGILMDTPLNILKWQTKKIPMMNHGGLDGFRGTQFSDSWTTRIFALAGARSSHCCLLSGSEPWRKASKAASKTCLWQLIWSWAVLLSSRLVFT